MCYSYLYIFLFRILSRYKAPKHRLVFKRFRLVLSPKDKAYQVEFKLVLGPIAKACYIQDLV